MRRRGEREDIEKLLLEKRFDISTNMMAVTKQNIDVRAERQINAIVLSFWLES